MADDADSPEGELTEGASETADGTSDTADESTADVQADDDAAADAAEETDADAAEPDEAAADGAEAAPAKSPMSHVRLTLIVALIVVLALGGLTGWLGYRAYNSYKADEQRKLFLQVGRQGALNLTTIDWQHADADVQRVLDSATGTFYDDFQSRSQPFVAVVKQAQSKSVGTVTEAGLESESGDQAKVIVAVTVQTSNAGAPEQQPRAWRMRITVQKDGEDNAKVANVEFVP
jgi:Mce-associated membrane protein